MKYAFAAVSTKLLLSLSLAAFSLPLLRAEPHCPGNVAILPFRLVLRSRIIVRVVINHRGPYDFLVDTGAYFTTLEPSLAVELQLKSQGTAEVVGVGFSEKASFTQIGLLETGSQAIANRVAEVLDLQGLQGTGLRVRGVLGGDFLGHFDVLIDYTHSMLCLDATKLMRTHVKGMRVELTIPVPATDGVPTTGLLLIPVHLSGAGARQLLLALDSGAQAPFLYDPGQYLAPELLRSRSVEGRGADGVKRAFSVLLPQDVQIGSLSFQQMSFVAPSRSEESTTASQVDGLLPTTLFRRVFVSYADHFALLDPRL
jgi:hypothetical protein